MNLHEYQSKTLAKQYGINVAHGILATSEQEALAAAEELGGKKWVIKAQVHAGGRGKAGGVKVVKSATEISAFVKQWLGQRLVTYQTTAEGQPVNHIWIEECTDIAQELYLGAVVDRVSERVVFIASTEGGVDIEKVANETPEKVLRTTIDPLIGAQAFQARALGFDLGFNPTQIKQFTPLFLSLYRMFMECDVSLLEINPLVITQSGDLLCLDAKINIDNNALYRLPAIVKLRDPKQEDAREAEAAVWDLNYVSLDGDIGCMVNGAGLAMGTMDMIKSHGGNPANFLDVGGGATRERVVEAFKIILSDKNVKSVLVNIFGGIVRCDLIAEGIIGAIKDIKIQVPVVVRLEGNNAKRGLELLAEAALAIHPADTLDKAAQLAVDTAK